ncbi:MAG: 3-deoxy-D-manno-octulosonic acid transferase [Candidatus Omnitrophica bacterium]|nr:3-deoxy-D-manno-octulosonic acid transferase [Candidatus Omnitrophota bacterium]
MRLIYDLIFFVYVLFSLPVYVIKGKFHQGFKQRLGILDVALKVRPIWVHAVSVGETKSCEHLIAGLRKLYPARPIAISTVTATGNKIARGLAGENDLVFYLPLDLSFIVERVVRKIDPVLFIIAETEIWPNLISSIHRRGVPVITVNARISDRSFKGYSMVKPLIKTILRMIDLFCAQTWDDAQRLLSLGVDEARIRITGNMKYDYAAPEKADFPEHRSKLGLDEKDILLVAGSTHPGEEAALLKIYKELLPEFPFLRLLIAPRHPERSEEIGQLAGKSGFEPLLVSKLDLSGNKRGALNVFILDTIGQLVSFYASADIVFIGGSLVKKGGHNILEPAAFAKPVLFGPYTFNFKDMVSLFLKNKGAVQARDAADLEEKIGYFLKNIAEAVKLGRRARELLLQNRGATKKNLDCLEAFLNGGKK